MKKIISLVVVLLFVVFAVFFYLGSLFTDKFVDEKIESISTGSDYSADTSSTDLTGYPFSLRRYFSACIKDSSEKPALARLKVSGEFKTDEKSGWLPYRSEQIYNALKPGFVRDSKIKTNALTWIRSVESFDKGEGNILIKFLSSLTISDEQSDEIDQSYLVYYLIESVMFPPSLLPSDKISWKKINNEIVEATLSYNKMSVSAKFHINRSNEIFKVTTTDNFKTSKNGYHKLPQTTLYSNYKWFGNYKVPTSSEVQWNFPDSSFTFSKLNITNVEYLNEQD